MKEFNFLLIFEYVLNSSRKPIPFYFNFYSFAHYDLVNPDERSQKSFKQK